MEEIKVGEYVRTKDGRIFKVKEINEDYLVEDIEYGGLGCFIEYAVNHSFNIIDLIEVKDILKIHNLKGDDITFCFEVYDEKTMMDFKLGIDEKEIELLSIVTKEQFEKIEYKIEEEK